MRVHQLCRQMAAYCHVVLLTYTRRGTEAEVAGMNQVVDTRALPRDDPVGSARRARQLATLVSRAPFHAQQWKGRHMQLALDTLLAEEQFDIVQLESSQMGWLRVRGDAHVVVDEHNIESELLARMAAAESSELRRYFNAWERVKYERFESSLWSGVAACLVTSARDETAIRRRAPGVPVEVVPNAVDLSYFQPLPVGVERDSIAFMGLMTYRPNLDAVYYFLDEILPLVRRGRPHAHLTVVGNGEAGDLEEIRRRGATATGWVADVRPHLARAAVVVVPLRVGGGTRLKVVEALSMGRPVVTTSLGREGIEVVSERNLLVEDDPREFAEAVCRVLDEPDLGQRLGAAGRALVEEKYSWERSGDVLRAFHGSLLGAPAEPSSPAASSRGPSG